jgi:hypothetical protein
MKGEQAECVMLCECRVGSSAYLGENLKDSFAGSNSRPRVRACTETGRIPSSRIFVMRALFLEARVRSETWAIPKEGNSLQLSRLRRSLGSHFSMFVME